jgi:ABC-type bacteriocin/lantibiotic exporter with double-glycine peptidase domain
MKSSSEFTPWILLAILPRSKVSFSVTLGLCQSAFAIAWPLLLYRAIDPLPQSIDASLMAHAAFIVIFFTISQWLAFYHATYNLKLIDCACSLLADKLYQQLVDLSWLSFRAQPRAYFYDLMMADFWRVRQGVSKLLDTAMVNSVVIIAMLASIGWISITIFLFCFCGMLIVALLSIATKRQTQPLLRSFQAGWREHHRWVASLLDKYELFKLGRGISKTAREHHNHVQDFLNTNTAMLKSQLFWSNWLTWVANMLRIGLLFVGGYLIQQQTITPQAFLIVLLFLNIIQSNLQPLNGVLFAYMDGIEASKTIAKYFRLKSQSSPSETCQPLNSLTLEDVSFDYTNPNKPVINKVSLKLQSGNVYLWRGRNGTGKSTMARIVLGQIIPISGKLQINGKLSGFSELVNYRNQMGLIDQHATLFDGTISENITFGQHFSNNIKLLSSETLITPLLPKQKDPYTYNVGERGEALSGGEARRIALLRELITNCNLLLLDEPANHLDKFSINLVKKSINEFKQGRIIIIISHQNDFDDIVDEILDFN